MMRIGTIGTGFIVDNFIDAVSKTDNAEVVVIYSRSEDTAQAFAAKHNLKKWPREIFFHG